MNDINGTNVGSLMKGPATTRDTNPLFPTYNAPGDQEYKGTIRHAMDRLGENEPPKKARTNPKEPNQKKPKEYVPNHKLLDTAALTQDRDTFYGQVERGPEIDVNKLYQASKEAQGKAPGVPKELKNDREFRYN